MRATGFLTPEHLRHGPVTFLSHSGSAFSAIAFNDRGIGFNLLVSSGQEVVTTQADYMEYALGLASTRVLALLLETVRDPARLPRATRARGGARHPGACDEGRAHGGCARAGHGPLRARWPASTAPTRRCSRATGCTRCARSTRWPTRWSCSRRLGACTGATASRACTTAGANARCSSIWQPTSACRSRRSASGTIARIDDAPRPGHGRGQPLGCLGDRHRRGRDLPRGVRGVRRRSRGERERLLHRHDRAGRAVQRGVSADLASTSHEGTDKPFCVLSNLASAVSADEARAPARSRHPRAGGNRQRAPGAAGICCATPPGARVPRRGRSNRWTTPCALGGGIGSRAASPLSELDGLALLADYGLSVVAARAAVTVDDAVAAAEAIGYPVVLKTAAPGIAHKSDVDGVRVGLADAEAVRGAYEDVAGRLGPEVVVAAMARPGVEVALGVLVDPDVRSVGAGRGRRRARRGAARPSGSRCVPLDDDEARRMIDDSADPPDPGGRPRRSRRPTSRALAHAVSRLSVLAHDLGDLLVGAGRQPGHRRARRLSSRSTYSSSPPRSDAGRTAGRGYAAIVIADPFDAYPGSVVLDGGLATELERRGADLRDDTVVGARARRGSGPRSSRCIAPTSTRAPTW